MKTLFAVFGIILQLYGTTHSLIIPDEVPSLLSVIYSNIPTIKKGTDSRVGWGFRLGDRADFQFLVELGPQTNTQPLANQGASSTSKRNVQNSLRNILYAQQQANKKQVISDTDGGKWLSQWSSLMRNPQKNTKPPSPEVVPIESEIPDLGIGEVDAKSVIPDDSTLALTELYKKKESTKQEENVTTNKEDLKENFKEIKITTQKPKTTTSAKDALDNVEIDEDEK